MIDFDALVVGPCAATFGEPVTFMPAEGPPFPITAIYTDRFQESKFEGGDEVVTARTMLGCQDSQFGANQPQQDDLFRVRGRLWRAADVLPDGHGHTRIHIMLASDQEADLPEAPPAS
jgi:hypothetical protein